MQVGELTVGRLVLQPGYRWSEHVRPTAGTDSCHFHHIGIAISGAAHFVMDDGRGVAVHETARIMALAAGGEVLLSDITKELSQGAPGEYQDRGVREMKGIPRPRQVFATGAQVRK